MPFANRDIYVALPPEVAEPGKCAKLVRSLYGTRDAPARWEALYTSTLQGFGFERGRASACCFHHPLRGLRCVVHGDDFTFTGYDEDLSWVQASMEKAFLCQVGGRLGGGAGDVQEVRLLSRVIRWTPQGLLYESDPRHAEQLARDLTALGEQAVQSPLSSPGLKRDATAVEEATPLTEAAAHQYRALAARANFLSLDRPDLGFAAKECCRKMSDPTSLDWAALVRLTRYLAGRPRLVYEFPWQDPGVGLSTYVDTDFAGCVITRKSTSGGMCMRGAHLLKHWSNTQQTIALSSGEAELAGIVKGAGEGMGMVSAARDLGVDVDLTILADSSAAIGICRRTGIGKVRHLAVGQLWVQERVRLGDFALVKHPGSANPADILTKAVAAELINRHIAAAGLRWEPGRPSSAPRLNGFAWALPAGAESQR